MTVKYLHIKEDSTISQIAEPAEPEAQGEVIRLALDELITEVGTALQDAHLDFSVFVAVPARWRMQRWVPLR
jgi:hypothetical protein